MSADLDWLWDPPLGDPEAEDIGRALGDAAIDAWEHRHGVRLPPVLRRAYRQQDGGRVKGSQRGAALLRLNDVTPVDVSDLDTTWCEGRLDAGRLFDLGYDDTGANLLLHYAAGSDGTGPAVHAHYNDGGSLESMGETVDALWAKDAG
jgi:hypothetical protein